MPTMSRRRVLALQAVGIIESISRIDDDGFVWEVSQSTFMRLMNSGEEETKTAIEDARRILEDEGAIEFFGDRYKFTEQDYGTDVQ